MRIVMSLVMLLLVVMLAACAAGGAAETTANDEGEADSGTALLLVTPVRENDYPAPGTAGNAYPGAPVEAEMPTGYPEDTMPVPAEDVDLADVPTAAPGNQPQVMPAPGRPDPTLSPSLVPLLAAITADLSAQIDVPAAAIHLVAIDPMDWPNGALGCPAEGMAYIEVIIAGMAITLQAGDDLYTYHTDSGQDYVLCRDGAPVSSGSVR